MSSFSIDEKNQYGIYIHLCQELGDVLYGKSNCKAGEGTGGCCNYVAAALYQLVDFKELDLKSVPQSWMLMYICEIWQKVLVRGLAKSAYFRSASPLVQRICQT